MTHIIKAFVISLLFAVSFNLIGCTGLVLGDEPFAVVVDNLRNYPIEMKRWVKETKKEKGHWVRQAKDGTYVLISLGKKKTEGYEIKIKNTDLTDDNKVVLKIDVIRPTKKEIEEMPEYINYPHKLVLIKPAFSKNDLIVQEL